MTRQELRLEALKLAVSCSIVEAQQGVTVDPEKIEQLADRYVGYVERVEAKDVADPQVLGYVDARGGITPGRDAYKRDGGESHRFPPNKSDPLGRGPQGFKVSGP